MPSKVNSLESYIVEHPMKRISIRLPSKKSHLAKEAIFTHSIQFLVVSLMLIAELLFHRLEKLR